MGVQFLTQDNFGLQNGGRSMVCDVDGVVLIMFKTDNCSHCKRFFPIFSRIANRDSRLMFGCVDVKNNRRVIEMAKNTKAPITAVPTFLLYTNGRVKAKYKGKMNEQSFVSFIDKALSDIGIQDQSTSTSSSFMNSQVPSSLNTVSYGSGVSSGGGGNKGQNKSVSSITKIPHNAPWKAYVNKGHFN